MKDKICMLAVTIAVILSIAAAIPLTNQDGNNDENQVKAPQEIANKSIAKRQTQELPLVIYDRIQVVTEDGKTCAFFKNDYNELVRIRCDPTCGIKFELTYIDVSYSLTFGCASDEENYLGLCYKKCSLLANPNFPRRTATNTCAKDGCGPTEDQDAGLCYPKCQPNYNGVGPVCWGHCDHFCPGHNDLGLYCYRWWPPHSCTKPSYGRGVGTLPNAPWTNGFGCNGFGVANDDGCARIDVSLKIPNLSC